MKLNPEFSFIHEAPGGGVVLRRGKQQHKFICCTNPEPFTCVVTGLDYYADGPCYTSEEAPGVLISGEGVVKLQRQAFSFL